MTRFSIKVRSVFAVAVLGASLFAPLLVWHHGNTALRRQQGLIQQQMAEAANLGKENEKSQPAAKESQQGLSPEELRELLRLRSDVAALRQQTNALERLKQENAQLEGESSTSEGPPKSDAELARELASQTFDAMTGVLKELPAACERYAREHQGHSPIDFARIRKYFPAASEASMPGLFTFTFVRDDGPKPGDALVLKEQSWRSLDGKVVKVYGFTNGLAREVSFPEDEAQRQFATWEADHMNSSSD